jgi:hypothetical protein
MQKYAVYWPEGGAASHYSVLIALLYGSLLCDYSVIIVIAR